MYISVITYGKAMEAIEKVLVYSLGLKGEELNDVMNDMEDALDYVSEACWDGDLE